MDGCLATNTRKPLRSSAAVQRLRVTSLVRWKGPIFLVVTKATSSALPRFGFGDRATLSENSA